MPILRNPRHEAFCQAFVTSGNASAAYRESGGNGNNADVMTDQVMGPPGGAPINWTKPLSQLALVGDDERSQLSGPGSRRRSQFRMGGQAAEVAARVADDHWARGGVADERSHEAVRQLRIAPQPCFSTTKSGKPNSLVT